MKYSAIVVDEGSTSLASTLETWKQGAKHILTPERDQELGGILGRCIHNRFGLYHLKEEPTGLEYTGKLIEMLKDIDVGVLLDTTMLDIDEENRCIHAINKEQGHIQLEGKAVVLNMGYRERTRGAIVIPENRPVDVFTTGTTQRYVDIEGYMIGKQVLILGSGDIGLIMTHHMSLEGVKVVSCVELCPYSNGLNRGIVQCLSDYNIPLYFSHTITDIQGDKRARRVIIQKVDGRQQLILETEITFDMDAVLLLVGLIPESELSKAAGLWMDSRTDGPVVCENMEAGTKGILAGGNAVHVHDLVDFVTAESERVRRSAAIYMI